MQSRRWLTLLTWLPVMALLGWLVVEQAKVWSAPTPKWLVAEDWLGESASCKDLDEMTGDF